jgi:hypothetical protein
MNQLNRELRHWERIYNTVRPHQALAILDPAAVPAPSFISTKGMKKCHYLLDGYTDLTPKAPRTQNPPTILFLAGVQVARVSFLSTLLLSLSIMRGFSV